MVKVGDKVKDKITGFTGIAIAKTEWLYGCMRVVVQSEKIGKDDKLVDFTFDEPQLEVIKPKKVKKENNDTGGPVKNPLVNITPSKR